MTLSWRTENGKQPAVIISIDQTDAIDQLKECFGNGHRVLNAAGVRTPSVQTLTRLDNLSGHGFLLDYSGDDTMIVLASWTSRCMGDEAYRTVTDRMQKIAHELRESRELKSAMQDQWNIGPGQIVEVDEPALVVPDFSPAGPHETPGFRTELRELLNKHSKDTETGMPDFILAQLMAGQLESLAEALKTSDDWKKS